MTETTTIQITKEQACELDARREYDDEPYKSVIARILKDGDGNNSAIDSDEVARKVAERLEGSKPLAEMEFDDWFEPDYAKTIATHIGSEIALSDVAVDHSPVLNRIDDLETQLPRKVADELSR
jgi:hypothetical protein